MNRREVGSVVELLFTNEVSFGVVEPLDPLAHLPDTKLGGSLVGTEVDAETVLLVLMPPPFKPAVVRPLIVAVPLSFII